MNRFAEIQELVNANHPEMRDGGFVHAVNIGKLPMDTSYELATGLELRRAIPIEINSLNNIIPVFYTSPGLIPLRNPYETNVTSSETSPGNVMFNFDEIPESEWRYHVIVFQGANVVLNRFVESTALTNSRFMLGPWVYASSFGRGFGGGPKELSLFFEDSKHSNNHFLSLTPSDLDEIRLVYEKFCNYPDDQLNLGEAIKQFVQLDQIPKYSPLRFLGYVSILESIITHAPDSKDPYDSLTRQVRQKMILLGSRSKLPLQYDLFGTGVTQQKLWNTLYSYRSAIAHGTKPDFSGDFKILKSPGVALDFILRATVSVMRQTLEEPELMKHLRQC